MARHVPAVLSSALLVLCVAVSALWVRSHRVTDDWLRNDPAAAVQLTSSVGYVTFHRMYWGDYMRRERPPGLHYQQLPPSPVYVGRPGCGCDLGAG